MATTGVKVIRMLAQRVYEAARAADVLPPEVSGYALDEGSQTYGRAWRMFGLRDDGAGAHYDDFTRGRNGYLGWTKAEAEQTLRGMLDTLWMIERAGR